MKRRTGGTADGSEKTHNKNETLTNEQILNSLHQLYVNSEYGLLKIGRSVGLLDLFAPRRKVNIMLMGNHSSGKSSFINWYIAHKVQKTGVAIETQGFSLVTCARQRETLTGAATLRVFPYLKPLEEIEGVVAYLNTELVPSQSRRFNLVTLIDTPGLADGELSYPYDIEKAIQWLGDKVDLIFVFFDPIGQALCKRTLSLVESLSHRYSEKMKFFLSKADEAGEEADRQKVMMQIVQELCKRPGLDQSGFDMMTIFIPDHDNLRRRDVMCTNQIDEACQLIDKTIALTIQKSFEQAQVDLDQIEELLNARLKQHQSDSGRNWSNMFKLLLLLLVALQLPLAIVMHQRNDLEKWIGKLSAPSSNSEMWVYPMLMFEFLLKIYSLITFELFRLQKLLLPTPAVYLAPVSFVGFVLPLALWARYKFRFMSTLKNADVKGLRQYKQMLKDARQNREELFGTYLNQMLVESDSY